MQMGFSRATFDLSRDKSYSFTMEVSGDGMEWTTFMEGTYRKTG
jgi:hypothetical protein